MLLMLLMLSASADGQSGGCPTSLKPRPNINELKNDYMSYWGTYKPPPFNGTELATIRNQFHNFTCGVMEYDPARAIVKGTLVPRKGWPWHVLVHVDRYTGYAYCGGVLISRLLVLSAASCKHTFGSAEMGTNIRRVYHPWKQEFTVMGRFKVPLNYSESANYARDNIALLYFNRIIHYNEYVRPVCLPWTEVMNFYDCYVVGFGGNKLPEDPLDLFYGLYQARVRWVHDELCRFFGRMHSLSLDSRVVCFEIVQRGSYPCESDDGSGVYCKDQGRWTLVGIVGNMRKTCSDQHPFFSVDVFSYMKWVLESAVNLLQGQPA